MQDQEIRPTPANLSDEELLDAIGLRLMLARKARRLPQREVEEATGIDTATLSRYENGKASLLPVTAILRLTEFYGVSLDWLLSDLGTTRVMSNGDVPTFELIEGEGAGQEPIQDSLFVGLAN